MKKKLQHVSAQSAIKRVKTLKEIHSNIVRMQQRSTAYQNKKQKTMSQLKERNKVYLLTKNLKTKKVSKKLNHVKIDPFFIKQEKKSVDYKLNLFSDIKIHSIFHVSLLKSANPKTFIQNTFHFQYEEKDEYEIEKMLEQDDQQYLVK